MFTSPLFTEWVKKQERIIIYFNVEDNAWYLEWFNERAKYKWHTHTNLTVLCTEAMNQ